LRNHEREVHSDLRPFVCRQIETDGTVLGCGKAFPRKSLLARHLGGKKAAEVCLLPVPILSDLPPPSTAIFAIPSAYDQDEVPSPYSSGSVDAEESLATYQPTEDAVSCEPTRIFASETIPGTGYVRRRQPYPLPLARQPPHAYRNFDWYLVTLNAAIHAIEQMLGTDLVLPGGLFKTLPLPRNTINTCHPCLAVGRDTRLHSSLALACLDLNQVAQQLTMNAEHPPLRVCVGILLLLALLFHQQGAIRVHLKFIDYLYDHFLQHGSNVSDNPMHASHRGQLSIGMWSTGGRHFLPVALARTLKKKMRSAEMTIDNDTLQEAMCRFLIDLESFDLEFFTCCE
jgi:hypothetical protein